MLTEAERYAETAAYTLVNRDAPVLVIALHGLGGARDQPLSTLGDLGDGIAVLAPDLRAHGETQADHSAHLLSFAQFTEDVIALATTLGLTEKPTYLTGISMGAAVALNLLRNNAFDVRGASLIRPAFSGIPVPTNLALMPIIGGLLRLNGSEGRDVFENLGAVKQMQKTFPSTANSLVEQFRKPRATELLARLCVIPTQTVYETGEQIKLTCPVQIIGCPDDPVHPLALSVEWSAVITGSTTHTVMSREIDGNAYSAEIRGLVQDHLQHCLE